jgi:putative AbiEi antitoxin of type IV toxin-antitoxin system
MRSQDSTVEEKLSRLATKQHGVVTRAQLLAAGVSHAGIQRRLAKGALLLEYRGVYRVGHRAPSLEARYLAAVKACGEGAVLCGMAAAYLWRLIRGQVPPPEVAAPTWRRVPGVRTRRTRTAATTFRGIRVATVPAVLVQLAAALDLEDLARACHEAGVRYRTTPRQVEAVLRPNAPGAAKLGRVLRGEARVTLSVLERGFLALLRDQGLPLPQTNRVASGRRVDCRWSAERLTVELNSYRYHGSRHAWERDHDRRREARARGDEFRSYTYDDVFVHSELMIAELRQLL